MRFPLAAALAASLASGAVLAAAPALADAPGDGFGRRGLPAWRRHAPVRHWGAARPRRHHGHAVAGPAYGPLPPFFAGTGSAAWHVHGPVEVALYREAYIGRGLVYNTPPTLDVPGPVLSARY